MIEDFCNFVKLVYMLFWLYYFGGMVCELVDLLVNKCYFDMVYFYIKYFDKLFMGLVIVLERVQDLVEMVKIVFGVDFVDQNCVMIQLINVNLLLVFDVIMFGVLKVYVSNNQICIVLLFILVGVMSLVIVVGMFSQVFVEVFVGCVFIQLVCFGVFVVFGVFVSLIFMQLGVLIFGSLEGFFLLNGVVKFVWCVGFLFCFGGFFMVFKFLDV